MQRLAARVLRDITEETALIEYARLGTHGLISHQQIMLLMPPTQSVPTWYVSERLHYKTDNTIHRSCREFATEQRVFASVGTDSLVPPVTHVISTRSVNTNSNKLTNDCL